MSAELSAWKARRVDADTSDLGNYRGQYDSQLNNIEREIGKAARVIGGLLGGDLSGKTYGDVCREFNFHNQRIIWIRYVWDYFREKLDQRDDANLKPTLEAADEVLWSCYHPYFLVEPAGTAAAHRRNLLRLHAKCAEIQGFIQALDVYVNTPRSDVVR